MIRAFAIVALLPLPLAAQELDCANAATQSAMNICAAQDLTAADEALNAAWTDAMARAKTVDAGMPEADRGAADALRAAQRAWITVRDSGCEAEAWTYSGGTMQPMVVANCKTRVTGARTAELRAFADQAEGM